MDALDGNDVDFALVAANATEYFRTAHATNLGLRAAGWEGCVTTSVHWRPHLDYDDRGPQLILCFRFFAENEADGVRWATAKILWLFPAETQSEMHCSPPLLKTSKMGLGPQVTVQRGVLLAADDLRWGLLTSVASLRSGAPGKFAVPSPTLDRFRGVLPWACVYPFVPCRCSGFNITCPRGWEVFLKFAFGGKYWSAFEEPRPCLALPWAKDQGRNELDVQNSRLIREGITERDVAVLRSRLESLDRAGFASFWPLLGECNASIPNQDSAQRPRLGSTFTGAVSTPHRVPDRH